MDEQARHIDLTDTAVNASTAGNADRGSAWAELDETFFRAVQDVFPHEFCFGAAVLLASNDEPVIDLPRPRSEPDVLSHAEKLERLNEEIDREQELRRAMRRHPSGRRRF